MVQKTSKTWQTLEAEVLENIISHLNPPNLVATCMLVCQSWRSAALSVAYAFPGRLVTTRTQLYEYLLGPTVRHQHWKEEKKPDIESHRSKAKKWKWPHRFGNLKKRYGEKDDEHLVRKFDTLVREGITHIEDESKADIERRWWGIQALYLRTLDLSSFRLFDVHDEKSDPSYQNYVLSLCRTASQTLTALRLHSVELEAVAEIVSHCHKLTELRVAFCHNVISKHAQRVRDYLSRLQIFHFEGCCGELADSHSGGPSIYRILLGGLTKGVLRSLGLTAIASLDDFTLDTIAPLAEGLRSLKLEYLDCAPPSEALTALFQNLKQLESLDFQTHQTFLTSKDLNLILDVCPLKRLRLFNVGRQNVLPASEPFPGHIQQPDHHISTVQNPNPLLAPFTQSINDDFAKRIISEFTHLRAILLPQHSLITEGNVYKIAQSCPLLEAVAIPSDVATDLVVERFVIVCKRLNYLDVAAGEEITDASFLTISKNARNLVALRARDVNKITKKGLEALLARSCCRRLESIDVSESCLSVLNTETLVAFEERFEICTLQWNQFVLGTFEVL
ncbi:hypothetical protein HK102_013212 [Quaeritorhiza haematococci]|nr:hypothetical protein HK102_013212 [Quaeritorhiza haematococci]